MGIDCDVDFCVVQFDCGYYWGGVVDGGRQWCDCLWCVDQCFVIGEQIDEMFVDGVDVLCMKQCVFVDMVVWGGNEIENCIDQ